MCLAVGIAGEGLMADVVYIREDEKSPEDRDWVLLDRTPSGKYVGSGSVAHEQSATFYRPPPADREAAIAHALEWADTHGVPKIYVRGTKTMPKGLRGEKRSGDVVGAAIKVAKIATGEIEEDSNEPQSAAAEVGRRGGKARAERMTAEQRTAAAKRAASKRWGR
jgi:hypothetical protein